MTTTKLYSESKGISQSACKDWLRLSPIQWRKVWIDGIKEEKNEDIFTLGTALDILLFTPNEFKNKFIVSDISIPSEAIANILKNVYNEIYRHNQNIQLMNQEENLPELLEETPFVLEFNKDRLVEHARRYQTIDKESREVKIGWQNNWGEEAIVKNLIKSGEEYYKFLIQSDGRKVISNSFYDLLTELSYKLHNDENTKKYFIPEEGVEIIFQHEIYTEYTAENNYTLPIKLSIDIKVIDHNKKTVEILDFKTDQSAHNAVYSIKKYGYDLQVSFYDHFDAQTCPYTKQGYTRLLPKNIFIDTKDKVPYIYQYRHIDTLIAKEGNEKYLPIVTGKLRKGWKQTLEEIAWHYHKDSWKYPKEMYDNGYIQLNLLNS